MADDNKVVSIFKKADDNWHENFESIEKRVLHTLFPLEGKQLDVAVFALSAVQIRCIKLMNKQQGKDLTTAEAASLLIGVIRQLRDRKSVV